MTSTKLGITWLIENGLWEGVMATVMHINGKVCDPIIWMFPCADCEFSTDAITTIGSIEKE